MKVTLFLPFSPHLNLKKEIHSADIFLLYLFFLLCTCKAIKLDKCPNINYIRAIMAQAVPPYGLCIYYLRIRISKQDGCPTYPICLPHNTKYIFQTKIV